MSCIHVSLSRIDKKKKKYRNTMSVIPIQPPTPMKTKQTKIADMVLLCLYELEVRNSSYIVHCRTRGKQKGFKQKYSIEVVKKIIYRSLNRRYYKPLKVL